MAISFVAAGSVVTGANPTVPVPAGYQQGDLLLTIVTSNTAISGPASPWRNIFPSLGSSQLLSIYYKFATTSGNETALTITTTGTTAKAVMLCYRGVNSIAGASSAATTASSATSLASPTVNSTTAANDFVLSIFADSAVATTWTAPGSTNTRVTSDATASLSGLLIVDESQASIGVTTARTASLSVADSITSTQLVLSEAAISNNITFVSSGTEATGNAPTVPLPTSYAVGDLLLLLVTSSLTPATPVGWTLLTSAANYGAFYKIATSSETSVSFSGLGTTAKGVMLAYRNAIYATTSGSSLATGTSPATTSTSYTIYPGSTAVCFYTDASSVTPSTWTAPSGTTARVNSANTTTLRGILVADFNTSFPSASISKTATITNSTTWTATPIELKQANTFYVDPQNGSDYSGGTFYTSAVKNISGATFSKGVYIGDTVRVKEAPLYNTGVNATWTSVQQRGVSPFNSQSTLNATNATPIVISTSLAHGYSTGDVVQISAVTGNTAANGIWKVTVINSTSFSLDDSSGNGPLGTNGVISPIFCRTIKTATPLVKPIASFAPAKTVSLGTRAAWVGANANITTSLTTFGKGAFYDNIAIAAGATTGKMAYYTLPSTLDLSSYQQLSLFIQQSGGATLGGLTISLCSDTTGDTPVNTFTIPSTAVTGVWCPFTFDNGSALGSSIKSISISRAVNNGAQTFFFNSIVACKAPTAVDGISNTSLVTKNNGTEGAYAVGGFGGSDGSIIFLENNPSSVELTITGGAYYGTTETVALYRIQPFNPFTLNSAALPATTTAANSYCIFPAVNGTASYPITYSGGWNGTDMSTRTGQTWFDNQNGYGYGLQNTSTVNYITTDRLNYSRVYYGWFGSSAFVGNIIQNCNYTAASNGIYISSNSQQQFQSCIVTNTSNYGLNMLYGSSDINNPIVINNCTFSGNTTYNVLANNIVYSYPYHTITNNSFNTSSNIGFFSNYEMYGTFTNNSFNYFNGSAIYTLAPILGTINNLTFVPEPNGGSQLIQANSGVAYSVLPQNIYSVWNNVTVNAPTTAYSQGLTTLSYALLGCSNFKFVNANFSATNVSYTGGNNLYDQGGAYLYNCTGFPSVISPSTTNIPPYFNNAAFYSQDDGGVVGNNKIYFSGGLATSQTAVRHTASGYAWSMAPTDTTTTTSTYPMKLKIASVAANSGSPVTISAWMRRTNTGLTMQLVCPANQPYGPATDTTSSMTAAANTWEQVSISFTPTQNGVFDIYAYAYGGTTYTGYVDDLSVSQ